MSKKLVFSAIGGAAILTVGMVWLVRGVLDTGLWGLWFAGVSAIVGIYTGGNVAQKQVISKHYRPELDEARRSENAGIVG